MTHRSAQALQVALLLFASACGRLEEVPPRDSAAVPRWSIDSARVLFTASRAGPSELYAFDLATGVERRLTQVGTAEGGANQGSISPDGTRLAFQVRRGTDYEIHVMDVGSSTSRNVTRHPEYDVNPVWSPDGGRLGFMSTRGFILGSLGPFPGHLYVLDLTADSLRRVTGAPLTSSLGPSDWAPDGATLLLARVVGEHPRVYALDLATGDEGPLEVNPPPGTSAYSATYAHAGDRVAFHSETDTASQIVVMAVDGSARRELTAGPGWRYNPRWSPDDQWILFTSSDDARQYDLRAVRVVDGALRDIVVTPQDEREGSWWYP